jgi:hypothetical protein
MDKLTEAAALYAAYQRHRRERCEEVLLYRQTSGRRSRASSRGTASAWRRSRSSATATRSAS